MGQFIRGIHVPGDLFLANPPMYLFDAIVLDTCGPVLFDQVKFCLEIKRALSQLTLFLELSWAAV